MSEEKSIISQIDDSTENSNTKPRKKNDEFLKGAFEENFPDFLRFIYPDIDLIVDFSKGIDFMDKELFAITKDREHSKGRREADLLAKLYLKDGTEKWVILNVEIEGGSDKGFAYRMFQYNYRIRDRYNVPVAAIAIFTGNKRQRRPKEYKDQVLGTKISFQYLTYHIFEHSEAELLKMNNPFALIVLACQKSLLESKLSVKELGKERMTIAKELLNYDVDHQRIVSLLIFLKNFIFISNDDINRMFDEHIFELTKGEINMGIIEVLKLQERNEGKVEGKLEVVENLILNYDFSDEIIAGIAKVTLGFVIEIRKGILQSIDKSDAMELS